MQAILRTTNMRLAGRYDSLTTNAVTAAAAMYAIKRPAPNTASSGAKSPKIASVTSSVMNKVGISCRRDEGSRCFLITAAFQ
jgi:hypothetical protein